MASYSIVTDKTLKSFVNNVLKTYIVPNMIKTNDNDFSSLYEEEKSNFQTLLTAIKLPQQDN